MGRKFRLQANRFCRYLKELVAYVHLNPLRTGVVSELKELSKYPYSGHRAILGKLNKDFQNAEPKSRRRKAPHEAV